MQVIKTFPNKSATSLADKAGYCAKFDTTGVNVTSAITDQPLGIITNAGDDEVLKSDVCIFGECKAVAAGNIVQGQKLTSHTDGRVVTSAGTACQDFAIALEGGVAGDWINIFVLGCAKTHA